MLFSRLEFASNKAAKKKIRKFDKDFVIYTEQLPKDVSWIKLLLLTCFLGLTGAEHYYVGKYFKGALMTLGTIFLVFCTVFNAQLVQYMETMYLYFPIGVTGFAWIVSIVYVASKKYKVPVIVDMPVAEDLRFQAQEQRADFDKVAAEIKEENQKLSKNKIKQKSVAQKDAKNFSNEDEAEKVETSPEEMSKDTSANLGKVLSEKATENETVKENENVTESIESSVENKGEIEENDNGGCVGEKAALMPSQTGKKKKKLHENGQKTETGEEQK
ncbi:MAG: hypothetical protein J6K39_03130 [Clostridia bacterium]|nr:hypothetical protein [Clostridia bacterium]